MRHQVAGYKLSRSKDQRTALRRVLIKQLFEHERIETTHAKAMAIRGAAEKLITLALNSSKSDSDVIKVNARRLAAARLGGINAAIVKKLFDDIAPRFTNRKGGYTRILKLGPRQGDAADMVLLELVEE
jgi:large subunit ribosomal protein L17